MVVDVRVPYHAGSFLSCLESLSLSWSTLLHGVSLLDVYVVR